jgi:8-oxo-dGTP pyrophosphatase MutT (NUDIX family)
VQWTKQNEQTVYENRWFSVNLADVELPDGRHLDHFLIRLRPVAVATVVNEANEVLLLWRHRFITDSWGWEIPAGNIDAGESPVEAAAREALEETGWRPAPLRPLLDYFPANGVSDQCHHLFLATGTATHVGEPTDPSESERVEWLPVPELRRVVTNGEMSNGLSLTAVLYALTTGALDLPVPDEVRPA